MKKKYNLQIFAEGGAGATSGADASGTGTAAESVTNGTAAGQEQSGAAEGTTAQTAGSEPETFESLIKGKFKSEYDTAVQKAINDRFKNLRHDHNNLVALQPALEVLSEKYGLDPAKIDYAKLADAISNDNSFYEDEALQRGMGVDEYKQYKSVMRENARLRNEHAEAQRVRAEEENFRKIVEQVPEVKSKYPGFDLNVEMGNEDFFRLIHNRVPVMTAYEVVHNNDIMNLAIQNATQQAQEKIANSIKANGARPNESVVSSTGGNTVKVDISKLTRKDFKEYQRRVRAGERITFR